MKQLLIFSTLIFMVQSCTVQPGKEESTVTQKSNSEKRLDRTQYGNPSVNRTDLLFDIAGNYTLKQEDPTDCEMALSLFYKKSFLQYNLKTNTRNLSGEAQIDLNENKDGYYLTLMNIEWSEYLGDITDDNPSEDNSLLPQDVQGVLYEDEITIQNSGNAMNYYVKIGECDLKFIHLIK